MIHDGAGQYSAAFDAVFAAASIESITTPPRAPQANAYAERSVRTLRHELLDRTLIWNQRQLRCLLEEYLAHYNQHRPHRSLDQHAPDHQGQVLEPHAGQAVDHRATCSGLINEYHLAA